MVSYMVSYSLENFEGAFYFFCTHKRFFSKRYFFHKTVILIIVKEIFNISAINNAGMLNFGFMESV